MATHLLLPDGTSLRFDAPEEAHQFLALRAPPLPSGPLAPPATIVSPPAKKKRRGGPGLCRSGPMEFKRTIEVFDGIGWHVPDPSLLKRHTTYVRHCDPQIEETIARDRAVEAAGYPLGTNQRFIRASYVRGERRIRFVYVDCRTGERDVAY